MAYPQVSDPEWLDANASDTVFYWNYRPYDWYGLRFYNGSAFADSVADSGLAGAVPAFGARRSRLGSLTSARNCRTDLRISPRQSMRPRHPVAQAALAVAAAVPAAVRSVGGKRCASESPYSFESKRPGVIRHRAFLSKSR